MSEVNFKKHRVFRDDVFDPETEFIPISAGQNLDLYRILAHEKPVIHTIGE